MNKKITATRNQRGSLIILSMIVIFAMSSIGLSLAQTVFIQYGSNKQRLYVENAIGAAEAGVSATKQQLDANSSFTGWNTANKQVLYNDATRGRADYSTVVTSNADGTKTIISTGYVYRPGDTVAYNNKRIKAIVQAGTQTITTPSVFAGAGGLIVSNGAVGPDNNGNVVNVLGKITMSNHGVIGGSSITGPAGTPTVNVANIACAQGGNYPVACPSNQQPLQLSGFSRIYGNVCATNQVDQYTAPFNNEGVFPPGTLQPNCVSPVAATPSFDKQGFVDSMTTSTAASDASCYGLGSNKIWQANRTYTGNVAAQFYCGVTVAGDVYITGTLRVDGNVTFRVQDGLTTPPTIVVNGKVDLANHVRKNNLGVGVRIISFHSNNSTYSNSTSQTTLPAADAQASASIRAIDCTFCTPDASILWSYFGRTYVGGPPSGALFNPVVGTGALMGVSVEISNYSFGLGGSTWMSTPPGTVTIPGKHTIVDYQQLY